MNHDLYRRACRLDAIELIALLGEGTFHQFHGGAATAGRFTWDEMHTEYEHVRGMAYRPPENEPLYVGRIPAATLPLVARSAELASQRRTRRGGLPGIESKSRQPGSALGSGAHSVGPAVGDLDGARSVCEHEGLRGSSSVDPVAVVDSDRGSRSYGGRREPHGSPARRRVVAGARISRHVRRREDRPLSTPTRARPRPRPARDHRPRRRAESARRQNAHDPDRPHGRGVSRCRSRIPRPIRPGTLRRATTRRSTCGVALCANRGRTGRRPISVRADLPLQIRTPASLLVEARQFLWFDHDGTLRARGDR